MALLKYKDNNGVWRTLFRDMMSAIKNRLRCDKNLHDLVDIAEARNALGIVGDNNHTHYHDDRYMGKINETKNWTEQKLSELEKNTDKKLQDFYAKIENLQRQIEILKQQVEQRDKTMQNILNIKIKELEKKVASIFDSEGKLVFPNGNRFWIR